MNAPVASFGGGAPRVRSSGRQGHQGARGSRVL